MWIWGWHGKFTRVWIKQKRWRPKKKVFSTKISTNSGCCLKILAISHEFLSEDQKKRSSSQRFYEIRCESTKITKNSSYSRILGRKTATWESLASICTPVAPSLLISSGHNFRFGAQAVIWGVGTAPECPPWRRACFWSGRSEVQISGQSNQIQCCNGSPSVRHFFKKSCVAQAQWRGDGPRKLVRCFGVIQRVSWTVWFWFDELKWQLKLHAQKNVKVLGENSTTKHTQN